MASEISPEILEDLALKLRANDHYAVLGVNKNATSQEIKKAYRRAALRFHPDKFNNGTERQKEQAETVFKMANEANEVLKDEASRSAYDADLAGGQSRANSSQPPQPPRAAPARPTARQVANPYQDFCKTMRDFMVNVLEDLNTDGDHDFSDQAGPLIVLSASHVFLQLVPSILVEAQKMDPLLLMMLTTGLGVLVALNQEEISRRLRAISWATLNPMVKRFVVLSFIQFYNTEIEGANRP